MSRQQAQGHSPALPPAGGVCPRKRLKSCLSPDSVFLLILQNPACVVVILIYDQVSVCVVARVKVGDHTGGDSQAPHHCKKYRKSSVGCGSRNSKDSWTWGPGPREIVHLALSGPSRSCLGLWVHVAVNLPPHLPELLSLGSQTRLYAKAAGHSDKHCQGQQKL